MISYELNQNDTREADAGANAEEAAKPSLFARIRRALAPKMAVWLITPAGRDAAVIYAAPPKKAAFVAAHALVFRHFFPHYSAWLPLHGYGDPDESDMPSYGLKSDAWHEYLSANVDAADEYLATLEIRRATYDRRAFASMVRVMCGSAPLGLDFETDEEIEYWLSAAEAALAEQEGRRDDAHEEEAREEKAKEVENPSAPLDKRGGKGHNVSESKDNAGAKSGPGRPRKKGGPAKKAPGSKKGDPNEN
ncbi:MAG: hypothetical protein KIG81_00475 [Thermoguttaceae bacterium]|nr:hypothetical protein [Thermoguttaceae bacterium]